MSFFKIIKLNIVSKKTSDELDALKEKVGVMYSVNTFTDTEYLELISLINKRKEDATSSTISNISGVLNED